MGVEQVLIRLGIALAIFLVFWLLHRLDPPKPPDDDREGW